jgi:hypothetical protein
MDPRAAIRVSFSNRRSPASVRTSIPASSVENFRDAWAIASDCVDSARMDELTAEQRLDKCEKAIEELQLALQVPPAPSVGGKDNQLAELLVLTRKNEAALAKMDSYINSEVRGRLSRITQDLRGMKPSY